MDDLARLAIIPAGLLVDYGKDSSISVAICAGSSGSTVWKPQAPTSNKPARRSPRAPQVRDVRTATAAELDALAQEAANAEAAAAAARENATATQELAANLRAQVRNLQAIAD